MNWRACLTRRAADARGRLHVQSSGGHSQPEAARASRTSQTPQPFAAALASPVVCGALSSVVSIGAEVEEVVAQVALASPPLKSDGVPSQCTSISPIRLYRTSSGTTAAVQPESVLGSLHARS